MQSSAAKVMLVAIALQESGLRWRKQIGGPARGFWQFETGGLRGVKSHSATENHCLRTEKHLGYQGCSIPELHEALTHNDFLAAAYARYLLWTLPQPLPQNDRDGWSQYLNAWRPGKPHPETWSGNWKKAQDLILLEEPW